MKLKDLHRTLGYNSLLENTEEGYVQVVALEAPHVEELGRWRSLLKRDVKAAGISEVEWCDETLHRSYLNATV